MFLKHFNKGKKFVCRTLNCVNYLLHALNSLTAYTLCILSTSKIKRNKDAMSFNYQNFLEKLMKNLKISFQK